MKNKLIILIFSIAGLVQCKSTIPLSDPISDFNLHEKAILDYYKSPEERKHAFHLLSRSCKWHKNALSCYNLAVLYFAEKEYTKAYQFTKRAVYIAPKDPQYLGMLQLTAIRSGKINELEKINPDIYSFTTSIMACETDPNRENCIINACKNKPLARINFTKLYYEEKKKENEFSSVWDTSWLIQNKKLPESAPMENALTKYWRDFRFQVKNGNEALARKSFTLFLHELKERESDRKYRELYSSLRIAARLLLEQDPFFKNFKEYAREL